MVNHLPPLKPIPIKERLSILYIEYGHLDVLDGAFVVVDKTGVRTHIPIGGVVCLMLDCHHTRGDEQHHCHIVETGN